MTTQDYRAAVQALTAAARLIQQHDVSSLLESFRTAQGCVEFFSPPLQNVDAWNADYELLQAALPLYRFAQKFSAIAAPHVEEVETP